MATRVGKSVEAMLPLVSCSSAGRNTRPQYWSGGTRAAGLFMRPWKHGDCSWEQMFQGPVSPPSRRPRSEVRNSTHRGFLLRRGPALVSEGVHELRGFEERETGFEGPGTCGGPPPLSRSWPLLWSPGRPLAAPPELDGRARGRVCARRSGTARRPRVAQARVDTACGPLAGEGNGCSRRGRRQSGWAFQFARSTAGRRSGGWCPSRACRVGSAGSHRGIWMPCCGRDWGCAGRHVRRSRWWPPLGVPEIAEPKAESSTRRICLRAARSKRRRSSGAAGSCGPEYRSGAGTGADGCAGCPRRASVAGAATMGVHDPRPTHAKMLLRQAGAARRLRTGLVIAIRCGGGAGPTCGGTGGWRRCGSRARSAGPATRRGHCRRGIA